MEISSRVRPQFYEDLAPELAYSKEIFFDHPIVWRCSEDVIPFLRDEFGHGIIHSKTVAIEAGAIILAEYSNIDMDFCRHLVIVIQLAGLLHDICRLEPDHASLGAKLSLKILKDYPLSDRDKKMIHFAIENHEAFKEKNTPPDYYHELLSGALYDSDKFRWGPDNFVTTLWEICDYQEWTLENIIEKFPNGLKHVESISETFRTPTGKIYGPEFITSGIEIGNYLYRRMKQLVRQQAQSSCQNQNYYS